MVPAPAQGHPQYSGEERLTHAVARPLQSRFRRRSVAIPGDMSVDISPPPSATEVCGRIDRNSLRLLLIDLPSHAYWQAIFFVEIMPATDNLHRSRCLIEGMWSRLSMRLTLRMPGWICCRNDGHGPPRSPNMSPRRPLIAAISPPRLSSGRGGGWRRQPDKTEAARHRWLSARSRSMTHG